MRFMGGAFCRWMFAGTAMGSVLSGCETLDDVRIEDKEARSYAGSIVVRPESLSYANGRHRGGLEIGYERHRGDNLQDIASGHRINFDNQTILGPRQVAAFADSMHYDVSYNHLMAIGRHFEIEPAAGLSYNITRISAETTTGAQQKILHRESSRAFNTSVTPRFKFNDYLAAEAKIRGDYASDGSHSETMFVALVLQPVPSVAIRAGYIDYSQELELPDTASNVDIVFSGPAVALRLTF